MGHDDNRSAPCTSYSRVPAAKPFLTLFLVLAAVGGQPFVDAENSRFEMNGTQNKLAPITPTNEDSKPESAVSYVAELFTNFVTARAKLCNNFLKQSEILVIYMCFDRPHVIRKALAAVVDAVDISDYDLLISQDGGSQYVIDIPIPSKVNFMYIKHPVNLGVGQHHYWARQFAFDVMAYELIMVIEEDNVVHPQALKVLHELGDLTADDNEVGLVSIADKDNSMLFDEARFAAAALRVDLDLGHLWVYALHAGRYSAVKDYLEDYYQAIKGHDYSLKDAPPLRDKLIKVFAARGLRTDVPVSEDSFLVRALEKEGFKRRLVTLVRLFEPLGWEAPRFRQDPNSFFSLYGKGVYEGTVEESAYEVTKNLDELAELERGCRERLDRVYQQYLGRDADQPSADSISLRLLTGKMNAVEMVRDMINSAEHRRYVRQFLVGKKQAAAGGARRLVGLGG